MLNIGRRTTNRNLRNPSIKLVKRLKSNRSDSADLPPSDPIRPQYLPSNAPSSWPSPQFNSIGIAQFSPRNPRSHWQAQSPLDPFLHSPWFWQLLRQPAKRQFSPFQPTRQTQDPFWQTPCSVQPLRQVRSAQFMPAHPSLHIHWRSLQKPFGPQSIKHASKITSKHFIYQETFLPSSKGGPNFMYDLESRKSSLTGLKSSPKFQVLILWQILHEECIIKIWIFSEKNFIICSNFY